MEPGSVVAFSLGALFGGWAAVITTHPYFPTRLKVVFVLFALALWALGFSHIPRG